MSARGNEGEGCAILIGITAVSIGIGCIFGAGWAFLAFGGTFLALVLVAS